MTLVLPRQTDRPAAAGGYASDRQIDLNNEPAPAVTGRGFGGRLLHWLERPAPPGAVPDEPCLW